MYFVGNSSRYIEVYWKNSKEMLLSHIRQLTIKAANKSKFYISGNMTIHPSTGVVFCSVHHSLFRRELVRHMYMWAFFKFYPNSNHQHVTLLITSLWKMNSFIKCWQVLLYNTYKSIDEFIQTEQCGNTASCFLSFDRRCVRTWTTRLRFGPRNIFFNVPISSALR